MRDSTIDTTLTLLASRRRRLVLRRLARDRGDWVAASTLADWMLERSAGDGVTGRSLRIDLHHAHLPKLAEADLVDYDPATGRVRYVGGPAEGLVDRLLDAAETVCPEA